MTSLFKPCTSLLLVSCLVGNFAAASVFEQEAIIQPLTQAFHTAKAAASKIDRDEEGAAITSQFRMGRRFFLGVTTFVTAFLAACRGGMSSQLAPPLPPPPLNSIQLFPTNHILNMPIDKAPVDVANTTRWLGPIVGQNLHPGFGGPLFDGMFNGLPINVVGNATPKAKVSFDKTVPNFESESDPLPAEGLPIPPNAVLEGDPAAENSMADRHLILVDTDNHVLHEMFQAHRVGDGTWTCIQYSRWDLDSNALRPNGWTSADAAGLPILPLLVRYDEVAAGAIKHALRITLPFTYTPHLWPARHDAPTGSPDSPPMGMRVRLMAAFDISSFSPVNQVILTALKTYGMYLADNGTPYFNIGGVPDPNWNDSDLHFLATIIAQFLEVVDVSAWQVSPDSGQANPPPGQISPAARAA